MHYVQSTEMFICMEQIIVCADIWNSVVTGVKYLTLTYRIFLEK
jgi:hypothetical protein